jgi:hypothetical protein
MRLVVILLFFSTFAMGGVTEIPKDQGIGFLLPSGWHVYVAPDGSGTIARYKPTYVFTASPKGVFDHEALRVAMNRSFARSEYKGSNIMYIEMIADDCGSMCSAPDIPEIQKTIDIAEQFYSQKAILDFPDVLRKNPIQQK